MPLKSREENDEKGGEKCHTPEWLAIEIAIFAQNVY